jgi:hypothetical protein
MHAGSPRSCRTVAVAMVGRHNGCCVSSRHRRIRVCPARSQVSLTRVRCGKSFVGVFVATLAEILNAGGFCWPLHFMLTKTTLSYMDAVQTKCRAGPGCRYSDPTTAIVSVCIVARFPGPVSYRSIGNHVAEACSEAPNIDVDTIHGLRHGHQQHRDSFQRFAETLSGIPPNSAA